MRVVNKRIQQPMHHVDGTRHATDQCVVEVVAAEEAPEARAALVLAHVVDGVVG